MMQQLSRPLHNDQLMNVAELAKDVHSLWDTGGSGILTVGAFSDRHTPLFLDFPVVFVSCVLPLKSPYRLATHTHTHTHTRTEKASGKQIDSAHVQTTHRFAVRADKSGRQKRSDSVQAQPDCQNIDLVALWARLE